MILGDQEEDTPYVIRMQAITDDGPGIISDSYEVTTGQKRKRFPSNWMKQTLNQLFIYAAIKISMGSVQRRKFGT